MKKNIIITGTGDFNKGGVSAISWNLTNNIKNKALAFVFYTFFKPDSKYIDIAKNKEINFCIYDSNGNKIIEQIKKYKKISNMLKNNNSSILHVNTSNAFTSFAYSTIAKKHNVKVVLHAHNSGTDNKRSYLIHKVFKALIDYKYCNTFLACSNKAAEWMFPKSVIESNNYIIIKNGIDIDKFTFNADIRNNIRKKLNIDNKFVIGHIGRFSYQKNHSFLINIFNEVYKKNKQSVLLLVGDGELTVEIKEKADKLGLSDSIIFYGSSDKANELYQAMDCFVFPSFSEGLGIVAIEAQAAGLKTLCADTIPEEARITTLFEYMSLNNSTEKWAEKILSYNNGYERKDMSEQIKNAGYDIRDSAKKLEEIYLELGEKQL